MHQDEEGGEENDMVLEEGDLEEAVLDQEPGLQFHTLQVGPKEQIF